MNANGTLWNGSARVARAIQVDAPMSLSRYYALEYRRTPPEPARKNRPAGEAPLVLAARRSGRLHRLAVAVASILL
jgi:hypothetical protein